MSNWVLPWNFTSIDCAVSYTTIQKGTTNSTINGKYSVARFCVTNSDTVRQKSGQCLINRDCTPVCTPDCISVQQTAWETEQLSVKELCTKSWISLCLRLKYHTSIYAKKDLFQTECFCCSLRSRFSRFVYTKRRYLIR